MLAIRLGLRQRHRDMVPLAVGDRHAGRTVYGVCARAYGRSRVRQEFAPKLEDVRALKRHAPRGGGRILSRVAPQDATVVFVHGRICLEEELDRLVREEREKRIVDILHHACLERQRGIVALAQDRAGPVLDPAGGAVSERNVCRHLAAVICRHLAAVKRVWRNGRVNGVVERHPRQRLRRRVEMFGRQEFSGRQRAHRDANLVEASAKRTATAVHSSDTDGI